MTPSKSEREGGTLRERFKKLNTFKIKVDPRYKYYYNVFVIDSDEEFIKISKRYNIIIPKGIHHIVGGFSGIPEGDLRKGILVLWNADLTLELIMHECVHSSVFAARFLNNRINIRGIKVEEQIAELQTFHVFQLMKKIFTNGEIALGDLKGTRTNYLESAEMYGY